MPSFTIIAEEGDAEPVLVEYGIALPQVGHELRVELQGQARSCEVTRVVHTVKPYTDFRHRHATTSVAEVYTKRI